MPIFIPDLFTSYINGRRQAVADNWQDLSNYNQIAAGQLNNAFNMATFDPRVRSTEALAQSNEQANALGGAQTDQALAQIAAQNKLGVPNLYAGAQAADLAFRQKLYNYYAQNVNNPYVAALLFGSAQYGQPGLNGQNGQIVQLGQNVQTKYDPNNPTGAPGLNKVPNAQQPSSTNSN